MNQTYNSIVEKYCYDDDTINCNIYGGLYQWAEAIQYKNNATNTTSPSPTFTGYVQGICPSGWHIPTEIEFQSVAYWTSDANKNLEIGQGTGTNSTGFSALLAGNKGNGGYGLLLTETRFWSSTESDNRKVIAQSFTDRAGISSDEKVNAYSIRCIKDQKNIIITSPKGGENWPVGTIQNITWTSSGVTNVKIEYTTNNGTSWSTISASVAASSGSYSWTIPNTPSTQCKIRISDASDSSVNSISINTFIIALSSFLVTTNPTSLTIIVDGSTYTSPKTFQWTSGTWHTLSVPSPQSGATGTQFIYNSWSNGGTQNQSIYVSDVPETYTANFTTQYYLTMVSGIGGTISSPSGNGYYNSGQSVYIDANANTGYFFSSWSGVGNGSYSGTTKATTVTMNGPITQTANFSLTQYTVSTSSSPLAGGSTSGGGTLNNGTSVTVTATPNTGYTFTNLQEGGNIVSTNASYTFILNSNRTLVANFSPIQCTVTLTSNPTAGGSTTGNGTFNYGSSITITATPSNGYKFVNWSEGTNVVTTNLSYVFILIASRTLTANFQQTSVTLNYSVSFSDVTNQNLYRMFGLPGTSNYSISQLMNGVQGNDWQVYYDNGNTADYFVKYDGSSTFNLNPGIGFWIISKQAVNVTGNVNAVNLTGDGTYTIPLHNGWNIISNPYVSTVAWSQIKSKNSISENLWDFGGSYYNSGTLEPYKGYYFNNATNLSGLKIPYFSSLAKYANEELGDEIRLKLIHNNFVKSEVIIGFDPNSKAGYDILDMYKPISDFETERIVLRNELLEGNYKYLFADFRPSEELNRYELNLKLLPNETYVIKKDGYIPISGMGICLVDERLNNLYDLTNSNEIKIKSSHAENKFALIIAGNNYIDELKQKCAKPLEFILEQNYPNPFNPTTTFRFTLANDANINFVLYNLLGEKVRSIINNELYKYGTYEISVNLKELPSGVYFYRLLADGHIKTKKLMLLK